MGIGVILLQSNSSLVKLLIKEGSMVSTELDNDRKNILHIMAQQCMTNQHTDMLKLFSVRAPSGQVITSAVHVE